MNEAYIHPSAVVDQGASLGGGTRVWHFSHISSGSVVGENCSLGQNTFVGSYAIVGDNVKVQNNVSIYDNVVLENDVFCGPSVVFTNVINPRAFIERKNEYRQTTIKKGASLGANSTIICGVTVGEYALVGAGAVVVSDVPAFALVVGVPGKQIGWVDKAGNRLDLPLNGEASFECKSSATIYRLSGSVLTCG